MIIRPALVEDLPAVSSLLAETWHDTYDAPYGRARVDAITARWHNVDALARQVGRDDACFLVAVDDADQIVGTALIRRVDETYAMLDRLYVNPTAQGLGVGSALFDACLAAFADVAEIRLEVEPANANAIAFYERRGFTTTGRTEDCASTGDGIPAIVMSRAVPTG